MNIQTISIVVPTKGCVNNCPFCVSRMHDSPYENKWNDIQMVKRIKYAIMNNVNTCIITGIGEPLQNISFLNKLSMLFNRLDDPFPNIELQTTGIFLLRNEKVFDNYTSALSNPIYTNLVLLKKLGVNTISLSVSNIFDDELNNKIICVLEKEKFYLENLIRILKNDGFNIRLSLNMLKEYDAYTPENIIERCKDLGADQITFRKMYCPKVNFTPQTEWVKENSAKESTLKKIKEYIQGTSINGHQDGNGKLLYQLPFGPFVYSIMGMSVVIDDNCMGQESRLNLKYVILRENGKLYSQWDDEGSLIF
jgi:organic radical activating enzyme